MYTYKVLKMSEFGNVVYLMLDTEFNGDRIGEVQGLLISKVRYNEAMKKLSKEQHGPAIKCYKGAYRMNTEEPYYTLEEMEQIVKAAGKDTFNKVGGKENKSVVYLPEGQNDKLYAMGLWNRGKKFDSDMEAF